MSSSQLEVIEVFGAGNPDANGIFVQIGVHNSRPVFAKSNEGVEWKVLHNGGTQWSMYDADGRLMYYSSQGDALPPTTGWCFATGCTPRPKIKYHRPCSYSSEVQERVWKKRRFTDAVVVCEGQRFDVYRATLSAASSVFEAAFESPMKEGETSLYEIRDSTPAAVEALLFFLHTGKMVVPEADLVPLLHLAVQYEVDELPGRAAAALLDNLSASNVQDRASALKLHQSKVSAQWKTMLAKLQEDRSLLAAVIPTWSSKPGCSAQGLKS